MSALFLRSLLSAIVFVTANGETERLGDGGSVAGTRPATHGDVLTPLVEKVTQKLLRRVGIEKTSEGVTPLMNFIARKGGPRAEAIKLHIILSRE